MPKLEFDFLSYTSFPSSVKYVNDTPGSWYWPPIVATNIPVTPGKKLRIEFKAKGTNIQPTGVDKVGCFLWVQAYDGKEWKEISRVPKFPHMLGTFNWAAFSGELTVPAGALLVRLGLGIASGTATQPSAFWLDDLKVFQDNALIYANDFNNWNPYVGAVVGGVGGALAGYVITKQPMYALAAIPTALVGAAVGLYTAKP
jgi:hypothetical protein